MMYAHRNTTQPEMTMDLGNFIQPNLWFSPAATNAATNAPPRVSADVFGTNGLTRTEIALKLVSAQKSDGRWLSGTNDVTSAALEILKSL